MRKCYVTMTDNFLSGWGKSDGKKNKLVIECDSLEEADIVALNAQDREEMKYVSVCTKMPKYDTNKYFVQIKTKEDMPNWFKPNYFRK